MKFKMTLEKETVIHKDIFRVLSFYVFGLPILSANVSAIVK